MSNGATQKSFPVHEQNEDCHRLTNRFDAASVGTQRSRNMLFSEPSPVNSARSDEPQFVPDSRGPVLMSHPSTIALEHPEQTAGHSTAQSSLHPGITSKRHSRERPALLPSSSYPHTQAIQRMPREGFEQMIPHIDAHSMHNATFGEGSFANAHNIKIGTAYMIDSSYRGNNHSITEGRVKGQRQTDQERRMKEEEFEAIILEKIASKGISAAMLYAKDRGYVPRCNDDTRQALCDRIIPWVQDDKETPRVLWLSGPAGVGKSAVAQTIAEILDRRGLLGGVFFFSRLNNRSDPNVVIPTLVYQLARRLPEYLKIITKKIIRDPLILDNNRSTQFRELIIDPFLSLSSQTSTVAQKPLLVIIDGLDECSNRGAQREFVEMIAKHSQLEGAALQFRWMICSRPEPDINVAFSSPLCEATCRQEKLEIDDPEAQSDALRILQKGFEDIRRRYSDEIADDWPTSHQMYYIASQASGHLGFVSFIIRFIGDDHYDDPPGQLDICLKFLRNTSGPGHPNPLHALDLVYTQIFSNIPANILPTTKRILGLFVRYRDLCPNVIVLANFLALNQTSFYRALRHLHSVIFVPSANDATKMSIKIYHASFTDYLKDSSRSGKFALNDEMLHLDVALAGLKWLSCASQKDLGRGNAWVDFSWLPPEAMRSSITRHLCHLSFTPCWKACTRVPIHTLTTLMKALEEFDFNLDFLKWGNSYAPVFVNFIRWLASLRARSSNILTIRDSPPFPQIPAIRLYQESKNPRAFVTPFPTAIEYNSDSFTVYLYLGKVDPVLFALEIRTSCSYTGFLIGN
ncbi:hypothetical protein NP233_g12448 [Leucocoprinus birnbaumii]|uniref:NACHT domain-containing protein n=1 Tax=Leucocoprinus birnbaumii TaxID=56174 RepID=A0AAD5YJF4_9AGAR|nr:hypothetical protein NP233_g12448 [Leucocoprinus birnbaumii]